MTVVGGIVTIVGTIIATILSIRAQGHQIDIDRQKKVDAGHLSFREAAKYANEVILTSLKETQADLEKQRQMYDEAKDLCDDVQSRISEIRMKLRAIMHELHDVIDKYKENTGAKNGIIDDLDKILKSLDEISKRRLQ